MTVINENHTVENEIVLSERVVTSEFRIIEIQENIRQRYVHVEVELGPFTTEERPNGETETRGTGRRGISVWSGEEYDAVRDTWRNEDLLAVVMAKMNG